MTTTLAIPGLMVSQFVEFLRRELAPTPGRWQATLRITLACIACTVPVMSFHLAQPLIVMIGMFLVAKEDISTTVLGTILAIIGITIGCGLLLLFYLCALDITWLRVLSVFACIGLGLWVSRVVNPPVIGIGIATVLGFGVTLPDSGFPVEMLNRFPFYYWRAWTLGLVVNLAVQFLLNPQTTQSVLQRGLAARLDAIEMLLRRLAASEPADPQHSSIAPFALAGVTKEIGLLKMAAEIEPWLKKYAAELRAQFIVIDRLATAAAVLEAQGVPFANKAVQQRLLNLADACARWRTAIKNHGPPDVAQSPPGSAGSISDQYAVPSLAEMERAAELMPLTFPGRKLTDELKPAPKTDKSGVLVPDALTNQEHLQFAIKGALAAFICYLVFTLAAYPTIYTSIITCIVCSLSTVGASLQKGVLRFTGAAIGGALGVISLMYIFPQLDSLGGFWLPFGAVTALASYVTFGSPRISYCGFQIGLAFYKCVLQTYGTYTELRVVRDRLVGVVLGLVVFGIINSWLWPVTALGTLREKLASVLRTLAQIAGLPDEENHAPRLTEAYALRLQVYQDFGTVSELLEGAKFEPGAERRKRLEAVRDAAQSLFLQQLAIIQHRPDLRPSSVPEPLREASAKFRATLAEVLLNLADRVERKTERPMPDIQSALTKLELTVASQIKNVTDANVAAQIRARLALYQETVPAAMRLIRL
ncbi:MAG TPA: FUSC family protein [Candidatus Acidoferrales bacterium]|nr:FUSC family protein [Candidatus Acidoferrales bacterium]